MEYFCANKIFTHFNGPELYKLINWKGLFESMSSGINMPEREIINLIDFTQVTKNDFYNVVSDEFKPIMKIMYDNEITLNELIDGPINIYKFLEGNSIYYTKKNICKLINERTFKFSEKNRIPRRVLNCIGNVNKEEATKLDENTTFFLKIYKINDCDNDLLLIEKAKTDQNKLRYLLHNFLKYLKFKNFKDTKMDKQLLIIKKILENIDTCDYGYINISTKKSKELYKTTNDYKSKPIKKCRELYRTSKDYMNPLLYVCTKFNNIDIIKLFLDSNKCSVSYCHTNDNDILRSCLSKITQDNKSNKINIIKYLLDNGANYLINIDGTKVLCTYNTRPGNDVSNELFFHEFGKLDKKLQEKQKELENLKCKRNRVYNPNI